MDTIIVDNEIEMRSFAEKLAKDCANQKKSLLIYLSGDLGTGKTTFTRYFIKAFGWREKVKSPTYTLVESYDLPNTNIYHLDLYRIASADEINFLGLEEIYNNSDNTVIILIEWAEKAASLLPAADISLKFDYIDGKDASRSILIGYKKS